MIKFLIFFIYKHNSSYIYVIVHCHKNQFWFYRTLPLIIKHQYTLHFTIYIFPAGIFTKPSSIQRNAFNESSISATYQNRRLKADIIEPIRADSYSAWRAR